MFRQKVKISSLFTDELFTAKVSFFAQNIFFSVIDNLIAQCLTLYSPDYILRRYLCITERWYEYIYFKCTFSTSSSLLQSQSDPSSISSSLASPPLLLLSEERELLIIAAESKLAVIERISSATKPNNKAH